jgi:3-hydroxy acid dehydrogenase/malonic semialdehyde reductase
MIQSSLAGKTVMVTGASSGIGKACAESFSSMGARVVIAARRLDRLTSLANELETLFGNHVIPFQMDVQNHAEVVAVFAELQKKNLAVDILVNNAGLALGTDLLQDAIVDNWEIMIDTNVKGLLYVTRECLKSMIERNVGHIINIGSVAGHVCYRTGNVYSATKHAVRAITQSLRLDLIGTALRVSEIAPGAVNTEFSEVRWNDRERAQKFYEGFDPLVAADIADAVIYCATRPPHVNISELVIYPQAQAATEIHRQGRPDNSAFEVKK